ARAPARAAPRRAGRPGPGRAGGGGAGRAGRDRGRRDREPGTSAVPPTPGVEFRVVKPLLLLSRGHDDADFLYACHLSVEQALYLRFAPGDDELVVPVLELGRAQREGRARRIRDRDEVGWTERQDTMTTWVDLARRLLAERGVTQVRVS